MHYNINVSLPLESFNTIIIVFIEKFWQMEFVSLFQGQVPVGCVVSGDLKMFNLHSCNLVEIVIIFLADVMLS